MSADDLRARLLLAAGSAYIKARGLDQASPPAQAEDYAGWLARQPPDYPGCDGVRVEVPLTDVLAAAKAVSDAQDYRQRYQSERDDLNTWIDGWQRARAAFVGAPTWRAGATAAVRVFGFRRGRVWGEWELRALCDRYYELSEGGIDYSTGIRHPCLGRHGAIERIAQERESSFSAVRKALQRAGVKGVPRE